MTIKFSDMVNHTLTRYESLKTVNFSLSKRKILFHAVCQEVLKDEYDENKINEEVPHGGLIGIGDSYLDLILNKFKIFRVHAAYHDAFGYCKSKFNKGPGYSYIIPFPFNSCFIGHVTGLYYWLYLTVSRSSFIARLDV